MRGPAWRGRRPPGPMSLRALRMVDDATMDVVEERPRRIAVGQRLEPMVDETLSPTGSLLFGTVAGRPVRPALRLIQGGRPL